MEMILTDANRIPLCYMDDVTIDVGIGEKEKNDFEITISRKNVKKYGVDVGFCFFAQDTEYGGIIEDIEINTSEDTMTLRGYTWRGLLEQIIIEPPKGQSYLTMSGDANDILRELLSTGTGLLFKVSEEKSGIYINSYKIRYVDALGAITKMLEQKDARIDIGATEGEPNEELKILIKAVKVTNYEKELQYDGDDDVNVNIRDCRSGINHLICLGTGEMADRTVVHLYAQLDGSISRKQYYKGTQERTAVYEYTSAESEEELIKGATDRLQELMNYKSADMTVTDIDLDIGDIVSARDRDAGILLSRPVVGKILRYSDGEESIEYKLKGEC